MSIIVIRTGFKYTFNISCEFEEDYENLLSWLENNCFDYNLANKINRFNIGLRFTNLSDYNYFTLIFDNDN